MPKKTGKNRAQVSLFPLPLEAKIAADAEVRLIDAYVNQLDLIKLGFKGENNMGASAYGSDVLLKIYLYGYLNKIRSSRRLERACEINIELHWLVNHLQPCYKTIADFRKDHPKALRAVMRDYTLLCKEWGLIDGTRVAADGTKVRGQNSRKNNFNEAKLKRHLKRISDQIEDTLAEYDRRDAQEASERKSELQQAAIDKLAALRSRKQAYEEMQQKLAASEESQISTTDADARSLIVKGRESQVGYNIQSVVDDKHKLILHVEATNVGDINALGSLAEKTQAILREGMASESLDPALAGVAMPSVEILADKGYHSADQLAAVESLGMLPYVAERKQSVKGQKKDCYGLEEFTYAAESDEYICPAGKSLKPTKKWYQRRSKSSKGGGQRYRYYRSPASRCAACPLRNNCLSSGEQKNRKGKTLHRLENAAAVTRNHQRLQSHPEVYQQRQAIVEHPFGTIKRSWGAYYTLLKGLEKVDGEYNLLACCYNIRRSISELGVLELLARLKDRKRPFLFEFLLSCATVPHKTSPSPQPLWRNKGASANPAVFA